MERLRIMGTERTTCPRSATWPDAGLTALVATALLVLTLLMAATSAFARPARQEIRGRLVEVRILVDGAPAPLWARSRTDDKHYFEAERGENYALELRNRTRKRIGVLISVDGLNVVSGGRTGLDANESMYVLEPRGHAVIRGWRTSLDHVQQFVFVDEERSYADRSGQANGDMGWIRVLAFEERQPQNLTGQRPRFEGRERAGGSPESSAGGAAPGKPGARDEGGPPAGEGRASSAAEPETAQRMRRDDDGTGAFPGTGWGERRRDRVEYTEFVAEPEPSDRLAFRYEYAAGLRELGFFPGRDRLAEREEGALGFARAPRW